MDPDACDPLVGSVPAVVNGALRPARNEFAIGNK